MIQVIVQFQRELSVTYSGETFQSPSNKIIEPVNEILSGFPDARIKPLFIGAMSDAEEHTRFYYVIYLDDLSRAQDLEHKLQSQPAVKTAYIKPQAEPT